MNWENIFTEAVIGIIGIVITALGTLVSYWISTKIKDEKLKNVLNSLNELVKKAVLEVYQTYVESLKANGAFNLDAQRNALQRALNIIKANMTTEVEEWLKTNVNDVETYLKSMIEAQIALLKNKEA